MSGFVHRSSELLLATLLVACGGHSENRAQPAADDSAGTGTAIGGSAEGGTFSVGDGAESSQESGGDEAGRRGEGGRRGQGGTLDNAGTEAAGARGYVSLIHSGTRRCENDDYCFGLSCYAPATFELKVCLAPCESDLGCALKEVCVRLEKLASTCYSQCDSPSDCYAGFDCIDLTGEGQLVCFPGSWAARRNDLGN